MLNKVVDEFSNVLVDAGSDHKGKAGAVREEMRGSPWYDDEWKTDKRLFLELRQLYLEDKSDENREVMCKQRSKYRQTCRRNKRLYNREQAEELFSLSKANS